MKWSEIIKLMFNTDRFGKINPIISLILFVGGWELNESTKILQSKILE